MHYVVTVEETWPLCQRGAEDGGPALTRIHGPATVDDAETECRVGLMQRYNTAQLFCYLLSAEVRSMMSYLDMLLVSYHETKRQYV